MRHRLVLPLLLIFAGSLLLYGCGGGSSSARTHGIGTMNIRLTDTPIDLSNVQSINVTLTSVAIFPEDEQEIEGDTENEMNEMEEGKPIILLDHPATFDLMQLMGGITTLLTSGQVPAGEYHLIRLEVSSATLVFKDG